MEGLFRHVVDIAHFMGISDKNGDIAEAWKDPMWLTHDKHSLYFAGKWQNYDSSGSLVAR
ncbi:hypothetical protein WM40_07115 [Robbsia andropogonis]|uniref:Uncharacterized protein n=1 Tax=Robbsia andropogonis TaxID=28092 RepID=A0A0F5K2U4_9BURK|nr:hypothetical protein [Robbsia andropogonis]KKB64250.1 hypothetical protein WM40_07115 [Robbsia andropogonis]MCP1118823.1 hypothetical protein [Robbsia andropogonis]MCP1128290.1 hypothetical protein [Robbsia andropogonis]